MAGTFAPGEQLQNAELCEWLGLSRTPVRDALGRLRDEGLVEMEPQRFTRVAPMTQRDVKEIIPLLAAIHAVATEAAVPRLDPPAKRRLRSFHGAFLAALRAGDAAHAYAADEAFHGVFVDACDNAELPRLLGRLTPRLHRLEALAGGGLPGRRSAAPHEAIMVRAESGAAVGAAAAARANWLTLGTVLERSLAEPA